MMLLMTLCVYYKIYKCFYDVMYILLNNINIFNDVMHMMLNDKSLLDFIED